MPDLISRKELSMKKHWRRGENTRGILAATSTTFVQLISKLRHSILCIIIIFQMKEAMKERSHNAALETIFSMDTNKTNSSYGRGPPKSSAACTSRPETAPLAIP